MFWEVVKWWGVHSESERTMNIASITSKQHKYVSKNVSNIKIRFAMLWYFICILIYKSCLKIRE